MPNAETAAGADPENQNLDAADPTSETSEANPELAELRETMLGLGAQVQGMAQILQGLAQPKPPQNNMTPERIGEIFKTDPGKAIQIAVETAVKSGLGSAKKEFSVEQQRVEFDRKTEEEFPAVKSDLQFQRLVKGQMKEMVDSGEFAPDSPRLLYRAAQIAALKYKPKTNAATQATGEQTSTGKTTGGMSAEPPRSGGAGKSAPTGDAQFDALCQMFGVKDKDKMKGRWDTHKKEGGRR